MKAFARNARTIATGLLLLLPASAAVADASACRPVLEKGWIRAAPPGSTALAGYGLLRNACDRPAEVVALKSGDFMMAMVHETRLESGVNVMRHVKRPVVAAHGEMRFAPNGMHLMLMHPRRALPEGAVVVVELLLADGRRVPVELGVRREAPP